MREPASVYEEMLDHALLYYPFAKKFGWLPSQVDRESRIVMQNLITIDSVLEDLRADLRSRNAPPDPAGGLRTGSMSG